MALITDRLIIKPLTIKDSSFIYKLVNTSEWIENIGNRNINSEIEATDYVQKIIDNPAINYWVVRIRENGEPVGITSFVKRDYLAHYDIGTAFLPFYTHNGYAYEAVKAMLHSIIHAEEHSHILSITKPANHNAIKLLKKLGVQFDKEIKIENEQLHVYSVSADKLMIDEIIDSFFKVFTNKNKKLPNWDLLKSICISEIQIINKQGTSHKIYDLDLFIEPRKKLLSDGRLKDFEEKEIYEETKIIGSIAQRYSRYEKSGIMEGSDFRQKGYKLFQLVKTKPSWKITSVIWEDKEETEKENR